MQNIKECGFVWSVIHAIVAVNSWCRKIFDAILGDCKVCTSNQEETLIHRFHGCFKVFVLWKFAQSILHHLLEEGVGLHLQFSWKMCIFGKLWPWKYKPKEHIWSLLQGVILWQSWLACNAKVFSNNKWPSLVL